MGGRRSTRQLLPRAAPETWKHTLRLFTPPTYVSTLLRRRSDLQSTPIADRPQTPRQAVTIPARCARLCSPRCQAGTRPGPPETQTRLPPRGGIWVPWPWAQRRVTLLIFPQRRGDVAQPLSPVRED